MFYGQALRNGLLEGALNGIVIAVAGMVSVIWFAL